MKSGMKLYLLFELILCLITLVFSKFFPQAAVTKCLGDNVTTKYTYNVSNTNFTSVVSVYWYYYNDKLIRREMLCYYTRQDDFTVMSELPRYNGRIKWIPDSLNIEIVNLTKEDEGMYIAQITVLDQGEFESGINNESLSLTVNDPCVKAKKMEDGCTEMTCNSGMANPKYSWQGGDVSNVTMKTYTACPSEHTNYTCCVDSAKTKCYTFSVNAVPGKSTGGSKTGVIIGVVVAVVVVVVGVVVAAVVICRKKRSDSKGSYMNP